MADELSNVPRERLAHVLGMILAKGLAAQPLALSSLVVQGEDNFVKICISTDTYGTSKQEYRTIYRKLARTAKRIGLAMPGVQ